MDSLNIDAFGETRGAFKCSRIFHSPTGKSTSKYILSNLEITLLFYLIPVYILYCHLCHKSNHSASILPSRGWDVKCQIFNEILCSPKAYIINNTYVGALKILFILEIYMSTPSIDCMYYVE